MLSCSALFLVASSLPAQTAGAARLSLQLSERSLELRKEVFSDDATVTHVDIAGLEPKLTQPTPGLPNLPFTLRHVAIPRGAKITGLEVKPGTPINVRGVSLVGWTQQDQPSADREPVPTSIPIDPETSQRLYYPHANGTPLDPAFQRQEVWPAREQVIIEGTEDKAGMQIVKLRIHPVQWYPDTGLLRFTPSIDIVVNHEGGEPATTMKTYRRAMELQEAAAQVSNADALGDFVGSYPTVPASLEAWYLIITDNYSWDAEAIVRGPALPGDMVAEFQRLADWKTQKGVQAAVVTISDIVDGKYGNFKATARDLQEVLRNFLKHAHAEFNTYWVLLGGDVAVVPARYVVMAHGSDDSYYAREDDSKPELGKSYWYDSGDTVRIHARSNIDLDTPIMTAKTGHLFERVNNPSAATPGWAYTTSDTYTTVSASKTEFVILRGSLTETQNQDFYVSASTNTIPTDLYYASLVGPDYGLPRRHDWDKNSNGIYGQFDGDTPLDGVDFQPDVALGRAPTESGAEAKVFVDKVLTYEKHDGLQSSFAHKLLLGSSNWSSSPTVEPGNSPQPPVDEYYSAAGSTTALLHFDGAPDADYSWRLIAYNAAGDWWIVPYNSSASASSLGWFYCTNSSYSSASEFSFTWKGVLLHFPIPTAYVKVRGPTGEIHPAKFFFDRVGMDRSAKEKEELKVQFEDDFPELEVRKRLYVDLLDVPDYPAPDLFELSTTLMQAELNSGYNIVSLSGHGNPNGCCGVNINYVKTLSNGVQAGIVYANSCLTAKFDASDSVGEEFLKRSGGGSVAYIGCSRFGWVKAGGGFENTFWESMAADRHLGRMHNSKALLTSGSNGRWSNFALNLLGDPEMEVWADTPPRLDIDLPIEVAQGFPLPIKTGGEKLARVSVLGTRGRLEIHYTQESDLASFSTRSFEVGDELLVTVTKPGFIPYQGKVKVVSGAEGTRFIRGDVNLDRKLDISDALYLLGALFLGDKSIQCEDAADTNDDGAVDISDARKILDFLFLGGRLPPDTVPGVPQTDSTADALGCEGADVNLR